MPLTFHVLVSFITMNLGKRVVFCLFYFFFNVSFEESHRGISGMEGKLMGQEWGFQEVLLRTMHSLQLKKQTQSKQNEFSNYSFLTETFYKSF